MFFYLAKALWFLLQPSTLIALLIGYGSILIWTGWARWGRRFVTVGAILLLIAGLSPLGNALILPLEDRFPRADLDAPPHATGFIVLGGAEDRLVGTARHAPTLNEAGERIVETVMLARRFPQAKIAFTGGDAGILYKSDSEADGRGDVAHRARRSARPADPRGEVRATLTRTPSISRRSSTGWRARSRQALGADHLRLSHAARDGLVPQRRLRGRAVAGRLPDARQRRSDAAVRQGLRGLAARRRRHARMGRAPRLLA